MLRSITGVLFVLLMTATLSAQRAPAKLPIKVRPGPVTEAGKQYRALLTEFGQQRLAYSKAYREAKTAADRVKVRQELYPQPGKLADKFLALAKEHADDQTTLYSGRFHVSGPSLRSCHKGIIVAVVAQSSSRAKDRSVFWRHER